MRCNIYSGIYWTCTKMFLASDCDNKKPQQFGHGVGFSDRTQHKFNHKRHHEIKIIFEQNTDIHVCRCKRHKCKACPLFLTSKIYPPEVQSPFQYRRLRLFVDFWIVFERQRLLRFWFDVSIFYLIWLGLESFLGVFY